MNCRQLAGTALAALSLAWGEAADAQSPVSVRTAVLYEAYSFDAGLPFSKVSEFTVPVTASYPLGRFGTATLSTGFTRAELTSADQTQLANQTITGALDTEARLSVNVIPGRLVALVTGAVPTGMKTVAFEELSILGAISSDVIGFSATNLGTGGNVGGGLVGAVPLGELALGFGATFRLPMEYRPVLDQTDRLRPGSEFRLRAGLEGAIGRRTYLRVAAIMARRGKDEIDDISQNGVGNRFIGYLSLNHGLGSSSVTVYAFDVFRGNPQIETTAVGAAVLQRGNLVVLGARVATPVSSTIDVVPRVEYRISDAVPDASTSGMRRLGSSLRFGTDFRVTVSRNLNLVVQGSGLLGSVRQAGGSIDITGFRTGVHLELRR